MMSFAFDKNGAVVPPTIEELEVLDKEEAILAYTDGTLEDGRPYYAYIAVKPSMYREFRALTAAHKPLVLGEYGTIIAADFAESPPESVEREMREQLGFDREYVQKMKQELNQQRDTFFKKQEDQRIGDIVSMLKKNGSATTN